MDSRQVVARFEAERQALALMDHPNIARILDGGTTEKGRPFFVMELVRGIPITDYCDRAALTTRQRLELFVQVCAAVQYAHQKGIIHRYAALGNAHAPSALAAGNTAPRGIAANAAGTTYWVTDANKTIYVYNAGGTLLGSWTAGGLAANAQVEGIAVAPNGTDVWLIDSSQDKVYKFTGAASRLSGTQSAASSFNLASGNGNGKGIVTDGTSLWVVDNGSTIDKVFKYTLSGALLGSWTITGGGGSPTGITLDPTNVSHLWIVDNGTDRVYQYTAATGRTSGSQSASATFALAPGNTNPQDIADPPPPSLLLTAVGEPRSALWDHGHPLAIAAGHDRSAAVRVESPLTNIWLAPDLDAERDRRKGHLVF
jgi:hypothetical protein